MTTKVDAYFAERDFTFQGKTKMRVRSRAKRIIGPHTLVLESSCGTEPERIAGSARIFAWDARNGDKPRVKRFSCESWRVGLAELDRLVGLLQ